MEIKPEKEDVCISFFALLSLISPSKLWYDSTVMELATCGPRQHFMWPAEDSAFLKNRVFVLAYRMYLFQLSLKPLQLVLISVTATKKRTTVTFYCV